MPTISLTLPVSGNVITAGLHATNYTSIQSLVNGGLDTANWASGKIFAPSKLMQESAVDGDGVAWDNGASTWKRTTDKTLRGGAINFNYGTGLPGSPVDGDLATLVDSTTNPTYQWLFRYHSGSSNTDKWEFIGGTPLKSTNDTSSAISSASYVDPTNNVSVTVPRAGQYLITYAFTDVPGTGTAFVTPKIGAGATTDADGWNNSAANTQSNSPTRVIQKAASASDVIKIQAKVAAGTFTITFLSLQVIPIRVS